MSIFPTSDYNPFTGDDEEIGGNEFLDRLKAMSPGKMILFSFVLVVMVAGILFGVVCLWGFVLMIVLGNAGFNIGFWNAWWLGLLSWLYLVLIRH